MPFKTSHHQNDSPKTILQNICTSKPIVTPVAPICIMYRLISPYWSSWGGIKEGTDRNKLNFSKESYVQSDRVLVRLTLEGGDSSYIKDSKSVLKDTKKITPKVSPLNWKWFYHVMTAITLPSTNGMVYMKSRHQSVSMPKYM